MTPEKAFGLDRAPVTDLEATSVPPPPECHGGSHDSFICGHPRGYELVPGQKYFIVRIEHFQDVSRVHLTMGCQHYLCHLLPDCDSTSSSPLNCIKPDSCCEAVNLGSAAWDY